MKAEKKSVQQTLAGLILDKYEQNSGDWKKYGDPEASGNRSLTIEQSMYDSIGRRKLIGEVLSLEKESTILFQAKWYSYGSELEKVTYRLQDMWYFYQLDGRRPKVECIRQLREEVEQLLEMSEFREEAEQLPDSREEGCFARIESMTEIQEVQKTAGLQPWIRDSLQELVRQLDDGLIPREYCTGNENKEQRKNPRKFLEDSGVSAQKEGYLKVFLALNELKEPVYRRVFSRHVLGDSKLFEKQIQRLVVRAARSFHPDVDHDENVMSDSEVLAQLNIETYDQELLIKGPLKLHLCGKVVDFSLLPYGAVLNSDTMKYAEILEEQPFRRVVTVENKANFMAASYEEGTLYIFTHGFFSPRERTFLQRLYRVLEGSAGEAAERDLCQDKRLYTSQNVCQDQNLRADQSLCFGQKAVVYLHSGDLDYGGIRIYQNIQKYIFPKLQPFRMDRETFEKYASELIPCENAYLEKLRNADIPPELEEMRQCILAAGGTIEQESMVEM